MATYNNRRRGRRLLPVCLRYSTLLLVLMSSVCQGQYRPMIGSPHPDFVLPDIGNREAVALSNFRGKKVVLIHFASW